MHRPDPPILAVIQGYNRRHHLTLPQVDAFAQLLATVAPFSPGIPIYTTAAARSWRRLITSAPWRSCPRRYAVTPLRLNAGSVEFRPSGVPALERLLGRRWSLPSPTPLRRYALTPEVCRSSPIRFSSLRTFSTIFLPKIVQKPLQCRFERSIHSHDSEPSFA
jgi:hypothetical protein